MKAQQYTGSFKTKMLPEQAIQVISNVKGWWATNVTGPSDKLNDRFVVRFGKTYAAIKVEEYMPLSKIVWHIEDCSLPLFANPFEWKDTRIVWDVSKAQTGSDVRMTHVGLTADMDCFEDCTKGWNYYVKESLHGLMESGTGHPGSGIFAKVQLNNELMEGLLYYKNDPLPIVLPGHNCIDVKTTTGETVTAYYSIFPFSNATFNLASLQGDYYMIVKDNRQPNEQHYTASFASDASPQQIYSAIQQVSAWWAIQTDCESTKKGDTFTIHFGTTFVDFLITEADSGKTMEWRVTRSFLPWLKDTREWTGTHVRFEIESVNGESIVTMQHTGLLPQVECYDNCQRGWNEFIIGSLPLLIKTGKGLPR